MPANQPNANPLPALKPLPAIPMPGNKPGQAGQIKGQPSPALPQQQPQLDPNKSTWKPSVVAPIAAAKGDMSTAFAQSLFKPQQKFSSAELKLAIDLGEKAGCSKTMKIPKKGKKKMYKKSDAPGPYQADRAARTMEISDAIRSETHNRHHHPFQYAFNPFIPGPITEVVDRLNRRLQASRATSPTMAATSEGLPFSPLPLAGIPAAIAMGGKDRRDKAKEMYAQGPEEQETKSILEDIAHVAAKKTHHEKQSGAMQAYQSGNVAGADKREAGLAFNRHEHPGHYLLNPFVGGSLTELLNKVKQRSAATITNYPGLGYAGALAGPIAGELVGPLAELGVDAGFVGGETIGGTAGKRQKAREIHETLDEEDKEKGKKHKKEGSFSSAELKLAIDLGVASARPEPTEEQMKNFAPIPTSGGVGSVIPQPKPIGIKRVGTSQFPRIPTAVPQNNVVQGIVKKSDSQSNLLERTYDDSPFGAADRLLFSKKKWPAAPNTQPPLSYRPSYEEQRGDPNKRYNQAIARLAGSSAGSAAVNASQPESLTRYPKDVTYNYDPNIPGPMWNSGIGPRNPGKLNSAVLQGGTGGMDQVASGGAYPGMAGGLGKTPFGATRYHINEFGPKQLNNEYAETEGNTASNTNTQLAPSAANPNTFTKPPTPAPVKPIIPPKATKPRYVQPPIPRPSIKSGEYIMNHVEWVASLVKKAEPVVKDTLLDNLFNPSETRTPPAYNTKPPNAYRPSYEQQRLGMPAVMPSTPYVKGNLSPSAPPINPAPTGTPPPTKPRYVQPPITIPTAPLNKPKYVQPPIPRPSPPIKQGSFIFALATKAANYTMNQYNYYNKTSLLTTSC